MRTGSVSRTLAVLVMAPAALGLGCGGGGDLIGPEVGTLEVVITTSGPQPDADGYAVSIDGAAPQPIEPNATRRHPGLAAGVHTVELSGVAANCSVAEGARLDVPVTANSVASAGFAIACAPTPGAIQVTTRTSGSDQDADGYTLTLDGGASQPIGIAATVTLANVSADSHTVQLLGVAANCVVSGGSERSVPVASGGTVELFFDVSCGNRPPEDGSLQVTVTTRGTSRDPDGYAVTLDGGEGISVGINAGLSLPNLTPGDHSVGLTGLSANCRLEGDNPRQVAITAGAATAVAFSIDCAQPEPSVGTLELVSTTTGSSLDPDGYSFVIDGGDAQAIGVNATVSIGNLPAGSHTLTLTDVQGNCAIEGENPRSFTVPEGGTARVAYSVTCTAATGGITVTTETSGSSVDADAYKVSVDGGAEHAVAVRGSVTIAELAPGDHTVLLGGVAGNCQVPGNPRQVTVIAAQTTTLAFAVTCAATTGSLSVTITGLPADIAADVTVAGPNGFVRKLTATTELPNLQPGSYTVTAADVGGATRYTATPATRAVDVTAAATARETVTYGSASGPSLNLRIDGLHLTQSIQTSSGGIPLVEGRDAYLRVFALANETNAAEPNVRVQVYVRGELRSTLIASAPESSAPTSRDEGRLGSSWNVLIPGSLIAPGLSLLAEVDPENTIAENNETDNRFPTSGTPQGAEVRTASALEVRFVPVKQRANGLQGDVSVGSKARFLESARRMYPLPATDSDVHAVYTTTTSDPLQAGDGNGAWLTVLSEIDALRVAEGTSRNYYGVVRVDYAAGMAGLGYLGLPTALGYDDELDRSRVMAHELGHNWDREHSPCGSPGDVDPLYPYPGGLIGVYGLDVPGEELKAPSFPDIMGYCRNPWISDYTYRAVLDYRNASSAASAMVAREQLCLLVWGRVVDGRPVLEPAFEVVTRPSLPKGTGPYSVEGLTDDGARLFGFSFDATEVADDPRRTRHFAFAVPLSQSSVERLGSLRLATPGGQAAAARARVAQPSGAAAPDSIVARRVAGGVALRWNASAHPMIMVRDAATGEVLSFARGGTAEVSTGSGELDLVVSDRVRSRRLRVAQ